MRVGGQLISMRSTWGPPGSCRPQMGPMLAPWTLLSGHTFKLVYCITTSRLSLMLIHAHHGSSINMSLLMPLLTKLSIILLYDNLSLRETEILHFISNASIYTPLYNDLVMVSPSSYICYWLLTSLMMTFYDVLYLNWLGQVNSAISFGDYGKKQLCLN